MTVSLAYYLIVYCPNSITLTLRQRPRQSVDFVATISTCRHCSKAGNFSVTFPFHGLRPRLLPKLTREKVLVKVGVTRFGLKLGTTHGDQRVSADVCAVSVGCSTGRCLCSCSQQWHCSATCSSAWVCSLNEVFTQSPTSSSSPWQSPTSWSPSLSCRSPSTLR